MKMIRTLAVLMVAIALFISCGINIIDSADKTGSVEVNILLNKVGQLSKVTEINLSNLYIEMSSGTSSVLDTIAVSGSSQIIVDRTYSNLTPGEWVLTAETVDDADSTIHEGSTTFMVVADQTTEVSLDLTSKYSMLTTNFVSIADSVSRLELLVNSTLVNDTSFTQGSEAGNTVSLGYDYLVSGESHTIALDAYGFMYGTYQLLFTGDTTITVIAGVDTSFTVLLLYVGPAEAPNGSAAVTITIGRAGRVTVNGEFPEGSVGTMTDIDGNVYSTVTIGDQWWMAENLKVTHYRNGESIPNVTDNSEWSNLTTGAYGEYDNSSANVATYGRLYNWYAVDDSRNIAPEGWHVPTDTEWKQLEMFLGMSQSEADESGRRGMDEGSQLADVAALWTDGALENNPAFGSSGFGALPGGYRSYVNGSFTNQGGGGYFWSSSEGGSGSSWDRRLDYFYSGVDRGSGNERGGFSVRCVRD